MVHPIGQDTSTALAANAFLGIGGYDTFTPTLVDGALPPGTQSVVTLGTDGGPPLFLSQAQSHD